MKRRIVLPLAAAACAGLFPLPANTAELETVVVTATRRSQPVSEVDASLSVIGAAAIEAVQHVHITELLSRVPGVWISRGNGQESLTAIRSPVLTGAGACGAFITQEDGIPTRAPGFCNVNQMLEVNTEQARQVEVLRGPASSVHGGNALHGVINVISPDVEPGDFGQFGVELGPDQFSRTRFSYNSGREDDTGWRVDGNASYDGGYKESSNYDQQKLNLAGRHLWGDWRARSHLSLTRLDQATAGFIEGKGSYKQGSQRRENPNPESWRDAESARAYLDLRRETAAGNLVQLMPYVRYTDMDFLQHFVLWEPIEKNGQVGGGVQSQFSGSLDSGWRWLAGTDFDYTRGYLEEYQPDESPLNPAAIPQGDHYDYDVDAITLAPFGRLEVGLTDNLDLNLGLRYDFTRYEYDNQLSDGPACTDPTVTCRFFRPADSNDNFGDWSPSAGFLYRFAPTMAMFGGVARGFRAPQTSELYRLQDNQMDADLNSVRLDSVELGFRGNWSDTSLETALFWMEKKNDIFQDSNRQNVDGGETSHRGIEAQLSQRLTDTLNVSASGTYALHRYANNIRISNQPIKDNDVDTAPKYLGWLTLGWDYTAAGRAELEWVHSGSYYLEPNNIAKYSGHDLFNLRWQYRLEDRWLLSARLNNLLDRNYADRADYAFGEYRYFVGLPRSLFVAVSRSF